MHGKAWQPPNLKMKGYKRGWQAPGWAGGDTFILEELWKMTALCMREMAPVGMDLWEV